MTKPVTIGQAHEYIIEAKKNGCEYITFTGKYGQEVERINKENLESLLKHYYSWSAPLELKIKHLEKVLIFNGEEIFDINYVWKHIGKTMNIKDPLNPSGKTISETTYNPVQITVTVTGNNKQTQLAGCISELITNFKSEGMTDEEVKNVLYFVRGFVE